MSIKKYLLAGFSVAILSLIYNYFIFSLFGIYPDLGFELKFLNFDHFGFYLVIFLKNFLVGLILSVLFAQGYNCFDKGKDEQTKDEVKGIFFFTLYAIFALLSFSLGDIFLMETPEGMVVLLTFDGFIETLIATIPIRIFHK